MRRTAAPRITMRHAVMPSTVNSMAVVSGVGWYFRPKRLHTTGMTDQFGPVKVGDAEYTLTRAGTDVPGEHVKAVRDAAKHARLKLRSTAAKS